MAVPPLYNGKGVPSGMVDEYRKCPGCERIFLIDKGRCLSSCNCWACGWQGYAFLLDKVTKQELRLVQAYEASEDKTAFLNEHPNVSFSKSGLIIKG